MNRTKTIAGFSILLVIIITSVFYRAAVLLQQETNTKLVSVGSDSKQPLMPESPTQTSASPQLSPALEQNALLAPMPSAAERVTKKMYGTYITPQKSPVQPERFKGYHTGTDFETFPEEKNSDVSIRTICSGTLVQKGRASGYGGYAVQRCTIEGLVVTIVYGHLRLSSVKPAIGDRLTAGDHLAMLGTGFSTETDGERKHLHLSIHKGLSVNIKGYVQSPAELSGWLDPQKILVF